MPIAAYIDTRTKHYNPALFKDYGFAISAGQTSVPTGETVSNAQLAVVSKDIFNELLIWLRRDIENNASLVKTVLAEIASADPYDRSFPINSTPISSHAWARFDQDVKKLTGLIAAGATLAPSAELVHLAQRVAARGEDNRSMEEWAQTLLRDVSHEND